MRRRPASFLWLLSLSAMAMVLSVLAPLLIRSLDQVTLAQAVERAGHGTAMIAASNAQGGTAEVGLASTADVLGAVHSSLWGPARAAIDSSAAYSWSGPRGVGAQAKTGIGAPASTSCFGAIFVSGRCPRADGEVALARGVAGRHLKVGDTITLDVSPATTLKVTGVYDDRSGAGAFLKSPSRAGGEGGVSTSPDLVVSVHEFDRLDLDGDAYAVRLLRRTVRLEDLDGVRADIQRAEATTLTAGTPESATRFTAGIQAVLDRIGPQQDAAAILLAVAALEALGLAWFAEALVVQRIGRSRAVEWGLARLRGLSRRRWLASVFVEPAVAVIVGSAVGVFIGIVVAHVSATVLLGPSAVVDPAQPLVIGAAALSLVGSLVALVASSVRSARLPLSTLLRETAEPRMLSRTALVGQTVIVLLAVVVIYSLVSETQISGPQLSVLAPVVIAVLVGIVALRIAIALIRRMTRTAPKSLNGLIVGRQLGRAPSALYVAVMVTLGIAILTYSAQTAVAADRLQHDRAAAAVGASQALDVSVPSDVDFVQAVRRADPGGTAAMAVEVKTGGTDAARLIAVDTSRIQAVSTWLPAWAGVSASQLRARLSPPTAAPMTITGTRISVSLAKVSNGSSAPDQTGPFLTMVVQSASGWHSVSFGTPRDGVLVSAPHAVPCSAGCRVVWFGETRNGDGSPPFSTTMTVTGFSTDEQTASDLSKWVDPGRWRNRIGDGSTSDTAPGAILSGRAGALRVTFFGSGGDTASMAIDDAPDPLPAIVGPETQLTYYPGLPGAFVGTGPDESTRILHLAGRARILPRLGGEGAMVDLSLVNRLTDPTKSDAQDEVWLSPGDHSRVLAALAREHIRVTGRVALAGVEAQYSSEAPARAAQLGLTVGAGALLLTFLGIVAIRMIGAVGRRRDWDSLRTAGVPTGLLRSALVIETLVPFGLAVVLGAAAGVVAFVLTVPHLPLTTGDGVVPPPDYTLSPLPLAAIVLGALALVAVIAVIGARLELRVRRPR